MEQASLVEGYKEYGKHSESEQKKGLFALKSVEVPPAFGTDITDQIRNVSRRLRILEERSANQRKNMQVLEHSMLGDNKKVQSQVRTLQTDFDDLKKQIYEMKQNFDLLTAELSETAKREDIIVLEKYINLWEPLNFVTRNEVEKIIQFILENKKATKTAVDSQHTPQKA